MDSKSQSPKSMMMEEKKLEIGSHSPALSEKNVQDRDEKLTRRVNAVPKGPTTTTKEVWAWWIYMMAIEPISPAVLQFLLPMVLNALPFMVGHIAGSPGTQCTGQKNELCVLFELGGWRITGTTFSYAMISLSVALQAIFFICFGALADYGSNRKMFLWFTTYFGSLCCVAALLIRSSWAAFVTGLLQILITITFGAALMLYNSYLPLLAENHPDTTEFRSDDPLEMVRRRETVAHRLSTISFMLGYGSAIVVLVLCALYFKFISESLTAPLYLIVFCGVIWAAGAAYPLLILKSRTGRNLPPGCNVLTFSVKKTFHTVALCKKLPNAFSFLVAYFLFADGCNTIGHLAVIFGKTVLKMSNFSLIICIIIAPIAGVLGNFFFFAVQRKLHLTSKTILMWILVDFILLDLYGMLGIFTSTLGLHHEWEMFMLAGWYGFHIGAMQSFSRVIFAELVPPGEESEFFSLYAITDKGSSWVGPAVQAIVTQYLPEQRLGLVFLAVMIAVSFPLLIWGFNPVKGKQQALDFSELITQMENQERNQRSSSPMSSPTGHSMTEKPE